MKRFLMLLSLALLSLVALAPISKGTEICSLPSATVTRDAHLNVGLENPCGFDVAVEFMVTFPDGKREIKELTARECGGSDAWQGSNDWQVDQFAYDYDDARPALCGGEQLDD